MFSTLKIKLSHETILLQVTVQVLTSIHFVVRNLFFKRLFPSGCFLTWTNVKYLHQLFHFVFTFLISWRCQAFKSLKDWSTWNKNYLWANSNLECYLPKIRPLGKVDKPLSKKLNCTTLVRLTLLVLRKELAFRWLTLHLDELTPDFTEFLECIATKTATATENIFTGGLQPNDGTLAQVSFSVPAFLRIRRKKFPTWTQGVMVKW